MWGEGGTDLATCHWRLRDNGASLPLGGYLPGVDPEETEHGHADSISGQHTHCQGRQYR
jgi:hypothetical protein